MRAHGQRVACGTFMRLTVAQRQSAATGATALAEGSAGKPVVGPVRRSLGEGIRGRLRNPVSRQARQETRERTLRLFRVAPATPGPSLPITARKDAFAVEEH